MKIVLTLILVTVFSMGYIFFYIAQPEKPVTNSSTIDESVIPLCLRDIPNRYNSSYLTYQGHFRAWYLRHYSWWLGVEDSDDIDYLKSYTLLKEPVECYIHFSGDTQLNMTLSPIEFEVVFNIKAEKYNIKDRLNYD